MEKRVQINGLKVDSSLYSLVESEITPGTGVEAGDFWAALARIVQDL